ncbi:hypothetical protein [Mesorhizobium sp. M6A.T.Ce.TU.016.01.1.1]|uniref:hypothetical protein n=1 Tax=Mesorhizobium sp. M6A.T.Ce.TU.016.01.1.1 TaxID=2496783 RepID=UPI000FCA51CB|nr:hypothetical protein [Mesorhizobium sp. M6A.T.Ce.TU.016.01.1.1]RUU29775.1 hypothetical protein EOC94_12980 [Mesorhizobium sp. M6A.T.Ce.TU.016.01.1.1]
MAGLKLGATSPLKVYLGATAVSKIYFGATEIWAAGGSGATLVAAAGSFALTGSTATLKRALKMSAAAGSFILTGNPATLFQGIPPLVADAGSFVLTGNATALLYGRRLAADVGAFALTGNAAGLKRQFRMAAGAGAFALTGNAATLTTGAPFPLVNGTNTSLNDTLVTSHTVLLPASITVGELLIIVITLGGASTTLSTPAGWNQLFKVEGSSRTSAGYYRVATGSEGASVSVTSGATRKSRHQSFRISNYQGTPEATAANSLSTNPDPPTLTPSWGSDDVLWIAFEGHRGGTSSPTTAAPSGYTNFATGTTTGAANDDAVCSTARLTSVASSENPGVFTVVNSNWVAATMAIRGT